MTVYRRNPLLMTVMGANPGPRSRKGAERALDAEISSSWHSLMSGVQVSVMDIPRIFRDIKLELAAGMPLEEAVLKVGSRYRVNRNPRRYRHVRRNPLNRDEEVRLYELAKDFHRNGLDAARRRSLQDLKEAMGELHALSSAAQQLGSGWNKTPGGARDTKLSVEISLLYNDLHEAGAQAGLWQSFFHGHRSPPKGVLPNPFGEAVVAGVTGAIMNRAFQSNPGPAFIVIDALSGVVVYTKRATGVGSEAIASCVAKAKLYANRTGHPHLVFLDIQGVKIGMKLNVPMVRVMGITEEIFPDGYGQGPRARLNPAIRSSWDGLSKRQRLAILEFAGVPEDEASYLCGKSWETMGAIDPRAQALVTRGWRDSSRTSRRTRETGTRMRQHETTVRMNPEQLRPKRSKIWCKLCGEWDPAKGPYHVMKVGPKKGSRLCDLCYRGIRSARRGGESWAKNPQANPGSKRKMTMTIERFAAWVKSKRDPTMWRAFLAKFRGYEKWTHGAKARKVTVEWVETPGVNGLWITYDGGKQPESTYIMPKGSPRKGAWKHPWDTMPDIKHDPEAKIVITKLRGSSKITDFYHK